MERKFEDQFFDLLLRTLNYAMEFVNQRGYCSLRFMDLFNNLLELQPFIKEVSEDEFYDRLRERIKERQLMGERGGRSKLQSELLKIFIEEWRRRTSQK